MLAIDPRYAPAWDGLALNLTNEVGNGLLTPQEGMPRVREAAEKAVTIDPEFALAWTRLGMLASHDNDLAGAAKNFERALALAPNDPLPAPHQRARGISREESKKRG